MHFPEANVEIEPDIDETSFVYIVLDGQVDYMMYKFDTKMHVVAQTFKSGEVFGDSSI